eukprot:7301292-Lingulodinium_polyedra.AAC.1
MHEPELEHVARAVFMVALRTRNVQLRRIHGHSGHPWNELADSCCTAAAAGRLGSPTPSTAHWRPLLDDQ